MNLNFAILVALAALLVESGPAPAVEPPAGAQPPATLRWQNGETLQGQILEGSAADVKWQTPLFEDPLATEVGGDSQDRSAARERLRP